MSEMTRAAEKAQRDVDVLIEAAHPSRPDREALVATHIARMKAEALQEQARQFRDVAAPVWGGSERWFTTGDNVADLVAGWCEDAALNYLEGQR